MDTLPIVTREVPVGVDDDVPAMTTAFQNFPNPFNPTTKTIAFELRARITKKMVLVR